jgi:DNA polymerase III delta prime subunit
MFFIDKYIPKSINDIFFHKSVYKLLNKMSQSHSVPHLIIYGNDGVGKNTLVNIFLKMLYGNDIQKTKRVLYNVSGSGNDSNDKYFIQSPNHIIIEPRGNNNDKYLIHDVVKVFASTTNTNIYCNKFDFKIVIIKNIEIMSQLVQFSLRRTIEQYSDMCRFILISNSITKISKPLISRCRTIKLENPTNEELIRYCIKISDKEDIKLTLDKMAYLITESDNNIKNVLWLLQILRTNNIYINTLDNKLDEYKERLNRINVNFTNKNEIMRLVKEANDTNYFYKKDMNTFINDELIKLLFMPIEQLRELYINFNDKKIYFLTCKDFLTKLTKSNYKKLELINNTFGKKIKLEVLINEIRMLLHQLIIIIQFLDIKNDKDQAYNELVKLALKSDFNLMPQIRYIIFNLLITNINTIDIIKNTVKIIFLNKKINNNKKLEAIHICQETEYNLTKGRREIIQFDNMFIKLITLFR